MSVTPRSTILFLSLLNAVSTNPLKSGYYFFPEEKNANSIDPEVYMNATELITSKGYPCENHYVTTADGFILNLQRIPHGRQTTSTHGWQKPVVLLQHGLLGSSDCFLQDLANESLAYILADHGMDVWLGNNRGNVYSRKHTILKPSMKEFWAWSWDETVKYDLPASLEHILKTTAADQLYYIGHSQGTEVAFAALSESKEVAARIKLFIAMAPIAYLGNIKGALRFLAPLTRNVQTVLSLLGEDEFMPKTEFNKWLATHVCNHRIPAAVICQNSNFMIGEYDFKEANKSRLPVYTAHFPAGTSVRNIVHHGQSVLSGKYQMFDFQSPEENMKHYNQTQLITSKGYPCENHYVTTEDGFILNLQRIPHGKKNTDKEGKTTKPVVLVQHGLLSSSTCFLENLANESLGFILADAGMDVWLGNSRGNFYSRKHKTLKPSEKEFWAWSWDEMAKYDMPANIEYILGLTGAKQITYIGHSQGTEMAFARLSEDAELNKMINLFVALAPIANLGNIKGPIKVFAPYSKDIEAFFDTLGIYEFLPDTKVNQWLAKNFCDKEIPEFFCENLMFLLCGFDYKETNMSRVPVYVGHNPAGTSVQNMLHYAQSVNSGLFQKFDYGSAEENMRHYNQTTPPLYDVKKIETPIALFTGPEDWLADPTDVSKLRPLLKNVIYDKDIPGWNHLDFIWGMNAPQACYKDIISLIGRIQQ